MRTYWARAGVFALVAALAACDDNPVDEGRGDASSLVLNPAFAVVNAADTTRVNAFARDRYGDMTRDRVQFSACDNKIAVRRDRTRVRLEPPDRALVLAQSLGESCVVVEGPGNLRDTVTIQIVPASLEVSLPGTIGSGESAQVDVTFLDRNGDPVSGLGISDVVFSLSDPAIADIDENGTITGKSPGSASVTVVLSSAWSADRSVSADFAVEPATFGGTISPSTADWGDTITITAGAVAFDDDTDVTFDDLMPYVVSASSSEIVVVGPAGMGSSPSDVLILNVGPNQLAFAATVEVPNPDPADANEPNNAGGGGGLSLGDLGETTPASLPFAEWISGGALDLDDVFQIDLAATTTVDFSIDWNFADADLDLLFYDGAGDLIFDFGCASTAVPEVCSVTLDPGTYYIDVNVFDAHGHDWVTILLEMSAAP